MTEGRDLGNPALAALAALAAPSAQLSKDTWMMMLRQLVVEL